MDIHFILESAVMLLETVFLCATMYFVIRAFKTKTFGKAGLFFLLYLVVNFIRRPLGL